MVETMVPDKDGLWYCGRCDRPFATKAELIEHERKHQ